MNSTELTGCPLHILLLGYSRIARKRIIPILESSRQISSLDVATKRLVETARAEQKMPGEIFDSYHEALEKSSATVVYVSLVNSDHTLWAEKALESGRHVIVDKPAFLNYADAERLVSLAKAKNCLLAEANVFSFHPQIEMIKEEFKKAKTTPTRISSMFSFPPLNEGDFRYLKSCGGGAINDLGPYAVSSGTVFFKGPLLKVYCHVNEYAASGVDTSFSLTAVYSKGCSMVGHFGFNTEYQNTLTLLGPSLSISLDRVFTIPPDDSNILRIRKQNTSDAVSVPKSDCFDNFFSCIFKAIAEKQFDDFYNDLLVQSKSLAMLKKSAEKESRP